MAALAKGMYALDAPVSGGDVGAKEARLAIMVGGDVDVFKALIPIFNFMGKNVILQGQAWLNHCMINLQNKAKKTEERKP